MISINTDIFLRLEKWYNVLVSTCICSNFIKARCHYITNQLKKYICNTLYLIYQYQSTDHSTINMQVVSSKQGLYSFHPYRPIQVPLQTVQIQMRQLVTSRLIRICTVCHSVFHFKLKHLFASMAMSKFKAGRLHFRNSQMKGLIM